MNILEKRMYSLNLYSLSPIQCGIQSGHSNVEYVMKNFYDSDLQDWANNWKTVILLNGGTSNSGNESVYDYPKAKGSMEMHLETLLKNNIKAEPFYEPDLNYCLTSISFLVDERVFNKKKYPDFDYDEYNLVPLRNIEDLELLKNGYYFKNSFYFNVDEIFNEWLDSIGGINILFLRIFLKDFKLSNN